jgi:hypothetical protein
MAFARRLVATTDQAFVAVTSSSAMARTLRLRVVPVIIPALFALPAMRRLLFRTVSQTALNYRGSRLSEGRAGTVHAGDRLPWVAIGSNDNFVPLTSLDWQVHVYGRAASQIEATCIAHSLPLHVFPWQGAMRRAGLQRDAVYLVRPDGYVALAAPTGSATDLAGYIGARLLQPRRSEALPR